MSDPALDDFKARLPLVEVVARYVRLTRRGREHVGLCPFHKEKTPSFNVVAEKGFYHCFGCNAHGNAIDFVMALEGLPFPEAIQRVADLTGIAPPERSAPAAPKPDPGLVEANAAAARLFAGWLWGEAGAGARAYLRERGLKRRAADRFGLGYAPDGNALLAALKREGFGEDLCVEAGLLARSEDGRAYDRFRHRLMFPIHDGRDRVVGFGGRALGEARAKYLNSPETPLFQKGRLLYGRTQAADAIRAKRRLVLVEGYMDVVGLAQAGIEEAVAPLGTSVTEEQLALLWRHADAPVVCLDGDKAGVAAALRLARRALPLMQGGRTLRFTVLPEGEDPDSLVRLEGAEAFAARLEGAISLSQLILKCHLPASGKTETPEGYALLKHSLYDYAKLAKDDGLRDGLFAYFGGHLDEYRPGRKKFQKSKPAGSFDPNPEIKSTLRSFTDDIFTTIIKHPDILAEISEWLGSLEFEPPELEAMKGEILDWYSNALTLDEAELRAQLTRYGFGPLVEKLLEGPAARGSYLLDVVEIQHKLMKLEQLQALRRDHMRLVACYEQGDFFSDEVEALKRSVDQLQNYTNLK